MRRLIQGLLCVALFSLLQGCGTETTVYDLLERPQDYAGRDVTVQGYYLWKPDGTSVLVVGISSLPNSTDAQPLDQPIWLEGVPDTLRTSLHQTADAAHGAVELRGRFEDSGGYGPTGAYPSQLVVSSASVIESIEYERYEAPRTAQPGEVSIYELEQNPAAYNGQRVVTRGFYFWTQPTSGLLASGVQSERPLPGETGMGLNPAPLNTPISMEGFPPDLSATLNVGPGNSFVWGLVKVTGTFQTDGQFGVNGVHRSQLIIEAVEPVQQP